MMTGKQNIIKCQKVCCQVDGGSWAISPPRRHTSSSPALLFSPYLLRCHCSFSSLPFHSLIFSIFPFLCSCAFLVFGRSLLPFLLFFFAVPRAILYASLIPYRGATRPGRRHGAGTRRGFAFVTISGSPVQEVNYGPRNLGPRTGSTERRWRCRCFSPISQGTRIPPGKGKVGQGLLPSTHPPPRSLLYLCVVRWGGRVRKGRETYTYRDLPSFSLSPPSLPRSIAQMWWWRSPTPSSTSWQIWQFQTR